MGFVKLDEDQFFVLVSKLRASLPEDVRRAGKLAENTTASWKWPKTRPKKP